MIFWIAVVVGAGIGLWIDIRFQVSERARIATERWLERVWPLQEKEKEK